MAFQAMDQPQENEVDEHHHYVSGFFATHDEAQETRAMLIKQGLPPAQVQQFATDLPAAAPVPREDSNAVLKDVFVDGTIGTAVGVGLGALAEVALVAANVSLFIASPLLAPLVMMGWGASIGAVIGTTVGATAHGNAASDSKDGWLSALVGDAIASGQVVLVVETRTETQTTTARDVIRAAVGGYRDVVAAV